jgi:hypothetical protein
MASSVNPMSPGSLVALVTPMHPDGELDLDALRALLRWHVASGTDGVVALGTTGEASTMSMDERAAVLRVCQQELAGKLPLMVGTGTIDPKKVAHASLFGELAEPASPFGVSDTHTSPFGASGRPASPLEPEVISMSRISAHPSSVVRPISPNPPTRPPPFTFRSSR